MNLIGGWDSYMLGQSCWWFLLMFDTHASFLLSGTWFYVITGEFVKAHDLEEGDLLMIYKNRQGNFVSQQLLFIFYLWNALIFAALYICSHTQFGKTNSVFALWFECSVNSDAVVKFWRTSLWFPLQINRIAKVALCAILLSVCESLDCVVEANWKCWKLDLSTEPCSRRVRTASKLLMGWFKHPTWLKIQRIVVEVNWYLVGNIYWPLVD